MRACLFGTYNRAHSANRIYAAAARAAGYEVIELHEPLWETTRDKSARYFAPLALARLGLRWGAASLRLARRWWTSGGAEVALVGFNGQLDVLLLRAITLGRYRPRIVFAPLVSITETLVDDRRLYRQGSLMARVFRALDRMACRAADVVVVDTRAHRDYFVERLGVDPARVAVCHLGVDNAVFRRTHGTEHGATAEAVSTLEVLYFGQYLPLHGLDVVVDAVGRLASRRGLRFVFIGTGEERTRIEPQLRATRADIEFIDWVDYERLGERIARADIVLGIFGSSPKAQMVIPNKVYEAAALGAAVVTADTPAVREVFVDGRDIVLCSADGAALARAIERLADDGGLRRRIGEAAARTVAERFSDAALGRAWAPLLSSDRTTGQTEAAQTATVGIVVLNYNDSESTLRCLGSLASSTYRDTKILVVDNGSQPDDRRNLELQMAGRFHARVKWLDENLGYARANNMAAEELFREGCAYVLILNNDTIATPDAVRALVACARRHPAAGPIGPRVARDWPGARPASLGERYWPALLWAPRSLVRYRRPRQRCYPVGGVLGCALLISRRAWDRLGGFDETLFAYYEEVDLCLRARAAGMQPRVEPMAEIAHAGHRGFAAGFTPVAAYLKARNLWRVGLRHSRGLGRIVFVCGYVALFVVSMLGYLARGRTDIVRALRTGFAAGRRGEIDAPPAWVFGR